MYKGLKFQSFISLVIAVSFGFGTSSICIGIGMFFISVILYEICLMLEKIYEKLNKK